MHDVYFWFAFFGAPLFVIAMTVYVFRPSAREKYREAKKLPFAEARQSDHLTP